MRFYTDEPRYRKMISPDSAFVLADDTSLLYRNGLGGDYSVLLGGNWRFELIVDSRTGLCAHMQSFLDSLQAQDARLELPDAAAGDLYFAAERPLEPGGGCRYHPFADRAFRDRERKILCFGDPFGEGEAVEFTPETIAVVRENRLISVFLNLSRTEGL